MSIASYFHPAWNSDVGQLGAIVGLVAGSLLLFVSASRHGRDSRPLLASLLAHGVLPYRHARVIASAAAPVQMFLALATAAALATGGRTVGLMASGLTGLFFSAMCVYLALVVRRNASATCACFGKERPLNWLVVARALVLGVAACAAILQDAWSLRGDELLVAVLAGVGASALLVWLPAKVGSVTSDVADETPVLGGLALSSGSFRD